MFCFYHASAFDTSSNIVKMSMNNKFKAQTLTGNPKWNYRCQLLASRALNMSCSFSQSVRSIESRCVVICQLVHPAHINRNIFPRHILQRYSHFLYENRVKYVLLHNMCIGNMKPPDIWTSEYIQQIFCMLFHPFYFAFGETNTFKLLIRKNMVLLK